MASEMQAVKMGQLGKIRRFICQLVIGGLRHKGVQNSTVYHFALTVNKRVNRRIYTLQVSGEIHIVNSFISRKYLRRRIGNQIIGYVERSKRLARWSRTVLTGYPVIRCSRSSCSACYRKKFQREDPSLVLVGVCTIE